MNDATQEGTNPGASAGVEREALAWMNDPYEYFGMSATRAHSVPREEMEAVQLAALRLRLAERREQIPVLARLADAQGITELNALDDAAPLLFEHKVYKSYPISLLAKQRFDQLTRWLDRLTPYDLTGVDVSQCNSIDEWLTKLRDDTPLDAATSSGTSGTMSVFPKSKRDYALAARSLRLQVLQQYGTVPTQEDIRGKIHFVTPNYRDGHASAGAFAKYVGAELGCGDETYIHTAFPYKISSDLMWLAARLRAAAAKGDVSRVDVPESLLARRGELERMQKEAPAQQTAFIREMTEQLKGQRVAALGTTIMFYDVARYGLEQGVRGVFTPDSVVMGGGGAKGVELPANVDQMICEFFGVPRMLTGYGMTEMNTFSVTCEHGHYHMLPWITIFLLDYESGRPLPRSGVQTGRAAFFDMTHDGTWGGIVTGDKITVHWDTPCACGRMTPYLEGKIQRFSDITGDDDKISCAATPGAQAEALDYLTSLDL